MPKICVRHGARNSGLRTISFADASTPTGIGYAGARVSFGYPDQDGSLLHELEQAGRATPWICTYTRDQSLDLLAQSGWIPKQTRARMIGYGRRLPCWDYYEERDPSVRVICIRHVFSNGLGMGMFTDCNSPIGKMITPARVYSTHWDIAEGGLLEEMRTGLEPMPWNSRAERAQTREEIVGRQTLDAGIRDQLLAFIDRAPAFEELE